MTWSYTKKEWKLVWDTEFLSARDGRLKADPLWGIVTKTISSLVLICDAKTWSPKEKEYDCFGHWAVLMCWSGVWLCTRDGRLKADPLRGWCHPNNLFLSLDLWCKTWFPKKRVKLFRTLDCLYVLIGCLTLYKRWETWSWPFKGLVSPRKFLP